MKKQNPIREAIDESLSAVHFTAADERAVLRAVHKRARHGQAPSRRAHAPQRRRLDLVFSLALLAVVVLPAAWFVLRARPASIVAGNGTAAPDVIVSAQTGATSPVPSPEPSPAVSAALSEAKYIAAARACFEEHCDTAVFSFEEYTVTMQAVTGGSGNALMDVELHSIYDNGCAFTVFLDAGSGEVFAYTEPALATQPQGVNMDSPEVQAWYGKYGPDFSLWPADAQAEFARRYEGKAPHADESENEEMRETSAAR